MNIKLPYTLFKAAIGVLHVKPPMRRDVLIIEDNDKEAELMELLIREHGLIPQRRATLNTALVALMERDWFAILLDLNLGGHGGRTMQGVEFAEEVAATKPHIPIIIVSGKLTDLEHDSAILRYPCIIKGTNFHYLREALTSVLSGNGQAAEMKLWRLFVFVTITNIISALAGWLIYHFNLLPKP